MNTSENWQDRARKYAEEAQRALPSEQELEILRDALTRSENLLKEITTILTNSREILADTPHARTMELELLPDKLDNIKGMLERIVLRK